MQQHPAFNSQHARMLLAHGMLNGAAGPRGVIGPPTTGGIGPPAGLYRPGGANLIPDHHSNLPPGRMRGPGGGTVIRQPSPRLPPYQPPLPHVPHHNGMSLTSTTTPSSSSSTPSPRTPRPQDTIQRIPHIAAQAGTLSEATLGRIDSASVSGKFGWTTIDSVEIPFLLREEKKYLAVRMVEMKLLSKYPSTYPDELKKRPPLMSHYITEYEARLLNEINIHHCNGEYGTQPFITQHLIVKMSDFEEFYNIVKKHFPSNMGSQSAAAPEKAVEGGWIQVNNTVVPFVYRNKVKYVPLSVIRYAAGLLTDIRVEGNPLKEDEWNYLNESCRSAGVEFTFSKTAKLVMLEVVQRLCNNTITVNELPKDDPFSQAQYQGEEEESPVSTNSMSLSTSQMPYQTNTGGRGPINGPSPPSATQPPPGANIPYWMNHHLGIYPGNSPGYPGGSGHMMRGGTRVPLGSAASPGIGRSSHISPPTTKPPASSSGGEVNNNYNRRPSHEAVDLTRELMSPRERKDGGTTTLPPGGVTMNRSLSSSSLSQSQVTAPRTSSAGSGGGMHRATPEGSPQTLVPGGGGMIPGIHPSLTHLPPDNLPLIPTIVPPGHPGWHPMMSNPAEYHKMVQIMQLQAMAHQHQHQQQQLQQQLQLLEQQHMQQQRFKQHEAVVKATRGPAPNKDIPRSSTIQYFPQSRSVSTNSTSQKVSSPSLHHPQTTTSATSVKLPTPAPPPPPPPPPPPTKTSLNQAVIQRVEFQGKTLSCIVKGEDKEYYALVEALSRVYFPQCSLEEFQFALETSLHVPLVQLSQEEERSFISFYNIPTKTLMCNKVIRLADFQDHIPKLRYMFKDKLPASQAEKITDPGAPRGTVLVENKNDKPISAPQPSLSTETLSKKVSAALKAVIGKRPASNDGDSEGGDSPGPAKQARANLEEAVNRLKQFQAEQKSKRKSSRPERMVGSQSPTSDTPTEYEARSPDVEKPGEMNKTDEDNTVDMSVTDVRGQSERREEDMEIDTSDSQIQGDNDRAVTTGLQLTAIPKPTVNLSDMEAVTETLERITDAVSVLSDTVNAVSALTDTVNAVSALSDSVNPIGALNTIRTLTGTVNPLGELTDTLDAVNVLTDTVNDVSEMVQTATDIVSMANTLDGDSSIDTLPAQPTDSSNSDNVQNISTTNTDTETVRKDNNKPENESEVREPEKEENIPDTDPQECPVDFSSKTLTDNSESTPPEKDETEIKIIDVRGEGEGEVGRETQPGTDTDDLLFPDLSITLSPTTPTSCPPVNLGEEETGGNGGDLIKLTQSTSEQKTQQEVYDMSQTREVEIQEAQKSDENTHVPPALDCYMSQTNYDLSEKVDVEEKEEENKSQTDAEETRHQMLAQHVSETHSTPDTSTQLLSETSQDQEDIGTNDIHVQHGDLPSGQSDPNVGEYTVSPEVETGSEEALPAALPLPLLSPSVSRGTSEQETVTLPVGEAGDQEVEGGEGKLPLAPSDPQHSPPDRESGEEKGKEKEIVEEMEIGEQIVEQSENDVPTEKAAENMDLDLNDKNKIIQDEHKPTATPQVDSILVDTVPEKVQRLSDAARSIKTAESWCDGRGEEEEMEVEDGGKECSMGDTVTTDKIPVTHDSVAVNVTCDSNSETAVDNAVTITKSISVTTTDTNVMTDTNSEDKFLDSSAVCESHSDTNMTFIDSGTVKSINTESSMRADSIIQTDSGFPLTDSEITNTESQIPTVTSTQNSSESVSTENMRENVTEASKIAVTPSATSLPTTCDSVEKLTEEGVTEVSSSNQDDIKLTVMPEGEQSEMEESSNTSIIHQTDVEDLQQVHEGMERDTEPSLSISQPVSLQETTLVQPKPTEAAISEAQTQELEPQSTEAPMSEAQTQEPQLQPTPAEPKPMTHEPEPTPQQPQPQVSLAPISEAKTQEPEPQPTSQEPQPQPTSQEPQPLLLFANSSESLSQSPVDPDCEPLPEDVALDGPILAPVALPQDLDTPTLVPEAPSQELVAPPQNPKSPEAPSQAPPQDLEAPSQAPVAPPQDLEAPHHAPEATPQATESTPQTASSQSSPDPPKPSLSIPAQPSSEPIIDLTLTPPPRSESIIDLTATPTGSLSPAPRLIQHAPSAIIRLFPGLDEEDDDCDTSYSDIEIITSGESQDEKDKPEIILTSGESQDENQDKPDKLPTSDEKSQNEVQKSGEISQNEVAGCGENKEKSQDENSQDKDKPCTAGREGSEGTEVGLATSVCEVSMEVDEEVSGVGEPMEVTLHPTPNSTPNTDTDHSDITEGKQVPTGMGEREGGEETEGEGQGKDTDPVILSDTKACDSSVSNSEDTLSTAQNEQNQKTDTFKNDGEPSGEERGAAQGERVDSEGPSPDVAAGPPTPKPT